MYYFVDKSGTALITLIENKQSRYQMQTASQTENKFVRTNFFLFACHD